MRSRVLRIGAAVASMALLQVPVLAQSNDADTEDTVTEAVPPPPCSEPVYSDFDFWLGTWEVTNQDGVVQGQNTITKEEYGCLVLERWTSANGGTGQSYNYVDPLSGKWRQVWVSAFSNIDYEGGKTEAGGIRLEGEITQRDGSQYPFVGEWIPRDDGTVLQIFHQYNPETKSWDEWFAGIYTRLEDDTGE
ncbi:MAG: hypothetical protein AAFS13_03735 [Pseudomonadota bacterium]